MTTEIRNWAVVAALMESQGATNSQMYIRAKALAEGQSDPMPTSFPAAPFSISPSIPVTLLMAISCAMVMPLVAMPCPQKVLPSAISLAGGDS